MSDTELDFSLPPEKGTWMPKITPQDIWDAAAATNIPHMGMVKPRRYGKGPMFSQNFEKLLAEAHITYTAYTWTPDGGKEGSP